MKLFYKSIFFPKAPKLVILHGLFGSSSNWMSLAKQFSKHFEVYVIDARNHGRSPKSEGFNYELMVNDLYEFVTAMSLFTIYLVGHSMGGKTAINFTAKYQHIVKKLIVVDIGPKYYPLHHEHIIAAMRKLDLDIISSRLEAEEKLMQDLSNKDLVLFLLQNIQRTKNKGFEWKINLEAIADNISEVGEPLDKNILVNVLSLFVYGGGSDYVLESDKPAIKSQFINCSFEEIPQVGHWLHAQEPKAFMDICLKYLLS